MMCIYHLPKKATSLHSNAEMKKKNPRLCECLHVIPKPASLGEFPIAKLMPMVMHGRRCLGLFPTMSYHIFSPVSLSEEH